MGRHLASQFYGRPQWEAQTSWLRSTFFTQRGPIVRQQLTRLLGQLGGSDCDDILAAEGYTHFSAPSQPSAGSDGCGCGADEGWSSSSGGCEAGAHTSAAEAAACGAGSPSPADQEAAGQGGCGVQAFSTGAAMVTAECCPAGQSGHRRRTQSGCDIPTICPSIGCGVTFTSFFAECAGRLASMPEVDPAPYAQLFGDCTAKMANGGAGFGAGASAGSNRGGAPCVDDPTGAIASLGVDCGLLVRANQPCAEDLHAAGWPVAAGQTMADTCPRTCHVC